jgi:hypothetical protein
MPSGATAESVGTPVPSRPGVAGAACPSHFRSVIGRAEITEVIARTSRDLMPALHDVILRCRSTRSIDSRRPPRPSSAWRRTSTSARSSRRSIDSSARDDPHGDSRIRAGHDAACSPTASVSEVRKPSVQRAFKRTGDRGRTGDVQLGKEMKADGDEPDFGVISVIPVVAARRVSSEFTGFRPFRCTTGTADSHPTSPRSPRPGAASPGSADTGGGSTSAGSQPVRR